MRADLGGASAEASPSRVGDRPPLELVSRSGRYAVIVGTIQAEQGRILGLVTAPANLDDGTPIAATLHCIATLHLDRGHDVELVRADRTGWPMSRSRRAEPAQHRAG